MTHAVVGQTCDNERSEAGRRVNVIPASDPPIRLHGKGAVVIMQQPRASVTPTNPTGGHDAH